MKGTKLVNWSSIGSKTEGHKREASNLPHQDEYILSTAIKKDEKVTSEVVSSDFVTGDANEEP